MSHLGHMVNYEDGELFVDSGASLHKMSKNQVTSVEKDTNRRSNGPIVITTANGQAESTEAATVYVNVLVAMMLLDDSPAVLPLGLPCDEMGYSFEWIEGDSPSLVNDGKILLFKSENHVQVQASGDRLQIPGVEVSGDQMRRFLFLKEVSLVSFPTHTMSLWNNL